MREEEEDGGSRLVLGLGFSHNDLKGENERFYIVDGGPRLIPLKFNFLDFDNLMTDASLLPLLLTAEYERLM